MRGGVNMGGGGRSWGSCSIHFAAGLLWSQPEPSALGANVVRVHMRKNISGGPRILATSRHFRVDCPSN